MRRERVELPDGDFLDLDWVGRDREEAPIVLILHGLCGSSESPYARGMLRAIEDRGWRGVVMHYRGCSGEPNRLSRSYHSGETGDLDFMVHRIRSQYELTPLALVGFSIGGNIVLKWLGETAVDSSKRGAPREVSAAVAVSVPFDLAAVATHMNRGMTRVYRDRLLHRLRQMTHLKRAHGLLELELTHAGIKELSTFRDFDDRVTAPMHGFSSADEYYERATCRPWLRRIEAPTLIVHARNDPFMPCGCVPGPDALSDRIEVILTPDGGHVGFLGGPWPWRPQRWLNEVIPAWVARRFSDG